MQGTGGGEGGGVDPLNLHPLFSENEQQNLLEKFDGKLRNTVEVEPPKSKHQNQR